MHNVEKLWKSARKNLRKSCGEKSGKVRMLEFSTKREEVFHSMNEIVEKFYIGFTHKLTGVKNEFYTISTGLTNTTIIL